MAAIITEVSRTAATNAKGARVCANTARADDTLDKIPPKKPNKKGLSPLLRSSEKRGTMTNNVTQISVVKSHVIYERGAPETLTPIPSIIEYAATIRAVVNAGSRALENDFLPLEKIKIKMPNDTLVIPAHAIIDKNLPGHILALRAISTGAAHRATG